MSKRYLDLSGYMFSGKSAASDILREFRGFHVPGYRKEFDLIRVAGGLADLAAAVMFSWSTIRVDAALRRFEHVMHVIAKRPTGAQRFYREGFGYAETYPNISDAVRTFVERITAVAWEMPWPYAVVEGDRGALRVFHDKLTARISDRNPWPIVRHRLVDRAVFYREASAFLDALLAPSAPASAHTIVLHNALEPYDPQSLFPLFSSVRSIIVDRDPRDIFVTGATYSSGFNDRVQTYSVVSGAHDVDLFVRKFELLRSNTNVAPHPGVLRVRFEELVWDYEASVDRIANFLEVDPSDHIRKGLHFDPVKSRANVGVWKTYPDQRQIARIRERLAEYCTLQDSHSGAAPQLR